MRLAKHFSLIGPAALLLAVGCGGDDGDDGDGNGPVEVDPAGTHTQYVIDKVKIPLNATEAQNAGRDMNGDGQPDNVLGGLLGGLASQADLDIQGPVDEQVQAGGIILLASLKATALDTAAGVGLYVLFGESATPEPCTDPGDLDTCGKHLEGTASFTVASDSPTDAVVTGQIAGGQLDTGPGNVSIELALSDGDPIQLDLSEAGVSGTVSATEISNGKLTGAVSLDSIENEILPAVADLLADLIAEDCTGTEPPCCEDSGSAGAAVLDFFDKAPEDCMVPLEELKADSLIQSTLFNPDLDLDGDGTEDALSIGVSFSAVAATFDVPTAIE